MFYAGHNEQLVGKAIETFRKQVVLATKFHLPKAQAAGGKGLEQEIRCHLEASMKNLRTDYVDLYYLHRVNELVPVEEVAEVMGKLVKAGLIRGWGLSQVSVETIEKAHAVTPVSAVQNLYNMMERDCEADIFPYCMDAPQIS